MVTKPTQLGPNVDKKMNELSTQIGEANAVIEEAVRRHDEAWAEVVEVFNEFVVEGKEARFVAADGHYLYKQPRKGGTSLDELRLKTLIFQAHERAEATKIWNSITVRKVDNELLEAAVQTRRLDSELVDSCIEKKPDSFSRIRKTWTKEDRIKAEVLGLTTEK